MPLNCKIVSKSDAATVGQKEMLGRQQSLVFFLFLLAPINFNMYTKGGLCKNLWTWLGNFLTYLAI